MSDHGSLKTKKAKDLQIGDRVIAEPHLGDRSWPVLAIRKLSGRLPIEVILERKGTYHYRLDDIVAVRE